MFDLFEYPKRMFDLLLLGDVQGILFLATAFVTLACLVSLAIQMKAARWQSVVGNLIKLELDGTGVRDHIGQGNYYIDAEYEYRVDGVNHKGRGVSLALIWTGKSMQFVLRRQMAAVQRQPDGKVLVFYDPKKPEKSYLIKPSMLSKILTLVPIVFMITIYVKGYL